MKREDPFSTTPATQFKEKSIRGGIASMIAQSLVIALQMGSTVVLARLLSPEDFGLQGMTVAVTGALGLFRDAGLNVASVQRESLTRPEASTLFWINTSIGLLLTMSTVALAPFLGAFFKEPRLSSIAIVSSLAFLFNGLGVQHRALLSRALRFATVARIDVIALAGSVCIGLSMAALGMGYWALVGMAVSYPLTGTVAAWIALPWMPGRPRRDTNVRSMLHMGGTVTLNSLVVYLAYNTEKILLGRVWGAEALGFYGRAFQLANLPIQHVTTAIGAVAFPMLARVQDERERLVRGFLTGYTVVTSLTVPVIVMYGVFAEELVAVILGQNWSRASAVLRLLVPLMLVLALVNPLGWFLQATARVRRSLGMALLIAPLVIAGVVLGLRYGPTGVAAGYSGAMSLLAVPLIVWALRGTGISAAEYWQAVWPALMSGLIAGVAAGLFKLAWGATITPFAGLVVGMAVTSAVYGWVLLVLMGRLQLYVELVSSVWPQRKDAVQRAA